METRTKIRAKYLRAIENEEWDLLPGPVYVKSFLRTYGDFLGLDSRLLVDEFKRRYERPTDQELRPIAPLAPRAGARRRAARCFHRGRSWSWSWWSSSAALSVVGSGSKSTTPPPPRARTHDRAAKHHRRRRTARPPRRRPSRGLSNCSWQPPAVYVCVVDGTGKKLIPGQIFGAGQTIPTETAPKLLLTLGNAAVT